MAGVGQVSVSNKRCRSFLTSSPPFCSLASLLKFLLETISQESQTALPRLTLPASQVREQSNPGTLTLLLLHSMVAVIARA